MSTSCLIGIRKAGTKHDTVKYTRVNWDGYLDGVGYNLVNYFIDENTIEKLIDGGELSQLSESIKSSVYYKKNQCDGDLPKEIDLDKYTLYEFDGNVEFLYLFQNGEWFAQGYECGYIKLKDWITINHTDESDGQSWDKIGEYYDRN